jgi:hypothetical protein
MPPIVALLHRCVQPVRSSLRACMTLEDTVSLWYVLAQGLFSGLIASVGMFLMSTRTNGFLSNSYWLWLIGTLACALLGPLSYMWMQSFQLSYLDAATLRVLRAGSWHVTRGYGLFGGVVLGGLAGFSVERLRKARPDG